MKLATLVVCFALAVSSPRDARAEVEFEWAGFGTIGAGVLDDDSINDTNGLPHNLYDEDLAFDVDSRLGFQGTAFFNDTFSATVQAVGKSVEDDVELEWAYVTYDINQQLKIRAGRQRRPLYALSDVLPVGYVYPWARPPVEVYARDIQLYDEIDAIDVLYQTRAGDWDVSTEVYYGGSSGEAEIAFDEDGDYETKGDYGFILGLEKDWLNLRFGYHRSPDIDVESSAGLVTLYDNLELAGFGSVAEEMETDDLEGEFFSIAAGVDYNDWLFNVELVHVPVDGGLVPEENSWYIMGGKRFGPWTVHLTYAERERDDQDLDFSDPIRQAAANPFLPPVAAAQLLALADGVDQAVEGLNIEQNSYTLGVRYDFNEPISIKAEYQYIEDEQFDLTNNLVSVVVDFLF